MRRLLALLSVLLASLLPASAPAEEEALHDRVNAAIDNGVKWLKAKQDPYGSWGAIGGDVNYAGGSDVYRYPQGMTAFALFTLLKCRVPPTDPVVRRGFEFIRKRGRIPKSTYEIAVLMLALEAKTNQVKRDRKLEVMRRLRAKPGQPVDLTVKLPRADKAWMKSLTEALLQRWNDGGWRYGIDVEVPGGDKDMSQTTFAMMALYVASRCGIKVPNRVVSRTMLWTLDEQEKEGPDHERYVPGADEDYAPPVDQARGWAYIRGSSNPREARATGTMTTGGVIVLLTGKAILNRQSPRTLKNMAGRVDRGIRDGMAWIDRNWMMGHNPPRGGYALMYIYGLERVGDLQRVHLIGGHDWYTEGAEWLVVRQAPTGYWRITDTHTPQSTINTCFALLFLEKATLAVTASD
jgi:hypothetical protein